MRYRHLISLAFSTALLLSSGCASVQYQALEKVGIHKRDILVDRVKDANLAQSETKSQFESAYEEFKALVGSGNKDLEAQYKTLEKSVSQSEKRANELDERIGAVERVANDLFKEWEEELAQYSSDTLRQSSATKLELTRSRYHKLRKQMRSAQARVTPVLEVLQDNTLFLKHNLNASAISGLNTEVAKIEARIGTLITEMERAIAEADAFVQAS